MKITITDDEIIIETQFGDVPQIDASGIKKWGYESKKKLFGTVHIFRRKETSEPCTDTCGGA